LPPTPTSSPSLHDALPISSASAVAGAPIEPFASQYWLSAPCTFTNQTIAGTIRNPNGNSQSPVQPATGDCFPSRWYILPISDGIDRKSTRLNSSHVSISYA